MLCYQRFLGDLGYKLSIHPFAGKFTERFGYSPSFASALAYDSASCLFVSLQKNPARSELKETLLNFGSFEGLQSEFIFNQYGDVERKLFLTTI